jgi:hypothetical protein
MSVKDRTQSSGSTGDNPSEQAEVESAAAASLNLNDITTYAILPVNEGNASWGSVCFGFSLLCPLADKVSTLQFPLASVAAIVLAIHRQPSNLNHERTKATPLCRTYILPIARIATRASMLRSDFPIVVAASPNSAFLRCWRSSSRIDLPTSWLNLINHNTRIIPGASYLSLGQSGYSQTPHALAFLPASVVPSKSAPSDSTPHQATHFAGPTPNLYPGRAGSHDQHRTPRFTEHKTCSRC